MDQSLPTDIDTLRSFIGRREEAVEFVGPAQMSLLAAWLDHATPPRTVAELPPLGHWFYFLPRALQSELGLDGHPRASGIVPSPPLPRRMWAGSRIDFIKPAPQSALLKQTITLLDATEKFGGSGRFIKLTFEKAVFSDDAMVIREEQDLIYREATREGAGSPSNAPQASPRPFDYSRSVTPDAAALFRFSALTFNAHRIHYDRDYAREEEGYPGLVVHGPMQAVLLMDLFLRHHPDKRVERFTCRAQRPLFEGADFILKAREAGPDVQLWSEDASGNVCMDASLVVRL